MKMAIRYIIILLLIILISGCQLAQSVEVTEKAQQPSATIQAPSDQLTGYPIISPTQVDSAYPSPVSHDEERSELSEGPRFEIYVPVKGGDFVIEGTGPANVPIKIIDVTEMGVELGETVINEEGKFRFELDEPVQSGHTIGIQLGDTSNTDLDPQDFLYSSTYYDRPHVGILFDIANVE